MLTVSKSLGRFLGDSTETEELTHFMITLQPYKSALNVPQEH